MEKFVKGEIIIFSFPFSDLSGSKRRPALVLAKLNGDDLICCQITSKNHSDDYSIALNSIDFNTGSLPVPSLIRPNRIFTVDHKIILRSGGRVSVLKLNEVIQKLLKILE